MTYKGHVRNGVVVLDDAVQLPEGAEVDVAIAPQDRSVPLSERLKNLIGKVEGLPPDASSQKNHYLYGHPKS